MTNETYFVNEYTLEYVGGHVEVYDPRGNFFFSADTEQEALQDLEDFLAA
jgi:hypothetical protein